MRIHVLQHVPFEDEAHVGVWAKKRGHTITRTRLYEAAPELPGPGELDWLVAMGGPMGVYDGDAHPWLAREAALIDEAITAGLRVLGICLGAQLIARVLRAAVTRNGHKEIGWFDVALTGSARGSSICRGLPDTFPAFHWHGDTFELPDGTVHVARTGPCENQAFATENGRVVGLQFHLEATEQSVARLLANCADELVDAPTVQTVEQMSGQAERIAASNAIMERILDTMASA